ncbi:25724_t:CDS:2, partial [Gigaspora margarita]
HSKTISDYDLSELLAKLMNSEFLALLLEELSYNINASDLAKINSLNEEQRALQEHTIDAEITTGDHHGKCVFIPRIPLFISEEARLPFILKYKQFPVRPAFALTINKAQGQTLSYIG